MTTSRRAAIRARLSAVARHLADERGDAAVIETLLWVPIVVVLLGLMALALRDRSTAAITQDAAEAGARAAARAPDPETGHRAAQQSAEATLADHPGTCDITVDTTTWDTGQVTVTVTCTTDHTGLDFLTPGSHQVSRTWSETVDAARITRTGPDT